MLRNSVFIYNNVSGRVARQTCARARQGRDGQLRVGKARGLPGILGNFPQWLPAGCAAATHLRTEGARASKNPAFTHKRLWPRCGFLLFIPALPFALNERPGLQAIQPMRAMARQGMVKRQEHKRAHPFWIETAGSTQSTPSSNGVRHEFL